MLTLAIDTTGLVAGIALASESAVIAEFSINNKLTHSQTLMPMIAQMFELSGIAQEKIDFISCACGPGSFTGLRIGAATAKGLAFGLGKKMAHVPTLDALAYNVSWHGGLTVPIMDARRNQVYTAVYSFNKNLINLSGYLAESIYELCDRLREYNDKILFLGDAVNQHRNYLEASGLDCTFAPNNSIVQRASSTAALGFEIYKQGLCVDAKNFELNYLRLSQAEREYNEKNG